MGSEATSPFGHCCTQLKKQNNTWTVLIFNFVIVIVNSTIYLFFFHAEHNFDQYGTHRMIYIYRNIKNQKCFLGGTN